MKATGAFMQYEMLHSNVEPVVHGCFRQLRNINRTAIAV